MRPTFFLRRTTVAPSKSSLSPRLRSRYQSTSPPEPEPVSKGNQKSSSPSSSSPPPSSPSQLHHSPATPPPEAPVSVPARSGPRSLRKIIQAGPVGRVGRSYSRYQERRPYVTQLCSSVVIYLCGDLTAQWLFPEGSVRAVEKGAETGEKDEDNVAVEGGGYDPWRTLRHLTVGIGSSIPSYNW